MTKHEQIAESWDTFWHGAQHSVAFSSDGTSHPLVLSFWDRFFQDVRTRYNAPKMVDIASGSGAVVERASASFDGVNADLTCLDISTSAIETLTERFPTVLGLVADARSIPLETASFDVVTSQFGVEYAGLSAIDEIVRLLAPGGQTALLLHHRAGGIHRQCSASLDAVEKMQAAEFIPRCTAMFDAGFAACRGGDKNKYDEAARKFVPVVRTMESIMAEHGTEVADGTIVRLYKDIRTISGRLSHYEPSEVSGWLEKMQNELAAFRGRMASMCDAAISSAEFEQLRQKFRQQGFEILLGEPLKQPERELPLAWALIAVKA